MSGYQRLQPIQHTRDIVSTYLESCTAWARMDRDGIGRKLDLVLLHVFESDDRRIDSLLSCGVHSCTSLVWFEAQRWTSVSTSRSGDF
jgi:hypothetical protein